MTCNLLFVLNIMVLFNIISMGSSKMHNCQLSCGEELESQPILLRGKDTPAQIGQKGEPGIPGRDCDCINTMNVRKPKMVISDSNDLQASMFKDLQDKYIALLDRVRRLEPPKTCATIKSLDPEAEDGLYTIFPYKTTNVGLNVFCDMTTDGGGWIVLQKRFDGSINFSRGWSEYVRGFGNKDGEYWIGLKHFHQLTTKYDAEVRIDMTDFEGNSKYAKYSEFHVGAGDGYTLTFGEYSGTAGDSLGLDNHHHSVKFSTVDKDQDNALRGSCSERWGGGWWFNRCFKTNLNGMHLRSSNKINQWEGIVWTTFNEHPTTPIKITEIKLREK